MPFIYIVFFWIYIPYKIISWLVDTLIADPLQRSIDRKIAKHETEKAFGKLNHSIEVYDPAKRDGDADQA